MESNSCGPTPARDIKAPKKQGNSCIDRFDMSNLMKSFVPVMGAAILSIVSLKDGFAQSTGAGSGIAQDAIAKNEAKPRFVSNDASPNDTSRATNTAYAKAAAESPLVPAIRQGHFGDAQGHSIKHNMMVVQIAGPALDKLKIEAKNIHDKFKNVTFPTDVVVFYKINPELTRVMGSIAMNGDLYKLPSGTAAFDAETLKKYADMFAKHYYKYYGQGATAGKGQTVTEPALAVNQP